MKLFKALLVAALALTLFFVSCDSIVEDEATDETQDIFDSELSERITVSADSVVTEMVKAMEAGGSTSDMSDYMESAAELYAEAAVTDPENSRANFGAGLFAFQSILDHPDIKMMQDKLQEWSQNMDDLDHARYYVTQFFLYGQSWVEITEQYGENRWTEYIDIDPASALLAMVYFVQNSMTEPDLIALFQETIDSYIIPALDDAIGYMDKVLTDDEFTYLLSADMTMEDDAMEVDNGEVYIISALMRIVRANLKIMNAYQLSIPGVGSMGNYFDEVSLINLVKAQDEQGGDFLKLRSNSILPSAGQDILDALTMVEESVIFIQQETDSQLNDIIKREDITEADQEIPSLIEYDMPVTVLQSVAGIADIVTALKTMFSGPFEIETFDGESITMDLTAFLNNGMQDLKALLPYHEWADINTFQKEFWGPVISQYDSFYYNNLEYQGYGVELFWMYQDITQEENNPFYELYGSFSNDGVFTVIGADTDQGFTLLEGGVNLTDDGAFYLDNQKSFCITEEAYTTINNYIENAPRNSWVALGLFETVGEHINLNFSIDHPFGIRNSDGVLKFAGNFEYIMDEAPLYLVDAKGSETDFPVFPDPTFGGLLPGMTQDKILNMATME